MAQLSALNGGSSAIALPYRKDTRSDEIRRVGASAYERFALVRSSPDYDIGQVRGHRRAQGFQRVVTLGL